MATKKKKAAKNPLHGGARAGSGRKVAGPTPLTIQFNMKMSKAQRYKLEVLACRHDISAGELVRRWIDQGAKIKKPRKVKS